MTAISKPGEIHHGNSCHLDVQMAWTTQEDGTMKSWVVCDECVMLHFTNELYFELVCLQLGIVVY